MADEDGKKGGWRIDKTIPVALIAGIALQTIVLVIWAVHVEDRVGALERAASTTETAARDTYATRESYARVDENIKDMKTDISSIKDDVRRLTIVRGGGR